MKKTFLVEVRDVEFVEYIYQKARYEADPVSCPT